MYCIPSDVNSTVAKEIFDSNDVDELHLDAFAIDCNEARMFDDAFSIRMVKNDEEYLL